MHIVIVDDSADILDSMSTLLQMMGHHVESFLNVEAAVAHIIETPPDVAFIDIGMPSVSGYDVAREVRKHASAQSATLIALTGWHREEDRQRSFDAGFDSHLVKPVDLARLRETLSNIAVIKSSRALE